MPPIDTPPTRPGRIARGAGAFAGILVLVLSLTPSALAGVVSAEGGTLRYASDPGEDDSLDVYYEAAQNRYVAEALRDSSEPPRTRAGPGCEDQGEFAAGFGVRGQRFTCSAAGVSAILLDIGDNPASGYQSATAVGALPAPVTLRMGPGRGALVGSDGNDLIEVSGDAVSYLQGQAGADTIRGGSATDRVNGGSGDDDIEGGAAVDTLYGDCCGEWEVPAGPDTGPDGNDRIDGGPGNDNMIGGAGDDTLTADARNDEAWCDDYTGDYQIGEGPPVPRQAPGDTFNTVDAENDGEGCETVNLAAPEPRPGPGPGGPFSASVPRQRHSAVMKSGLKFVARAPTRGTLTAALRFDDATRKRLGVPRQVGRVFKRPVAPGANTITVPLGQPFKKRLRRASRLKLTLNIRYTDVGGRLTVLDKTIVLRRR